jgi:ribonucleotide reductase beta subunit family protein with ferritin-like domain
VMLIRSRLRTVGNRYGYPNLHKWYHFRAVVFGVITSVVLFSGFQGMFYFYTQSFKRPNAESIQYIINDHLREELC